MLVPFLWLAIDLYTHLIRVVAMVGVVAFQVSRVLKHTYMYQQYLHLNTYDDNYMRAILTSYSKQYLTRLSHAFTIYGLTGIVASITG